MSADGRTIRDVMVDAMSEPNMGFAEGRHGRLVERQLLRLAEAGFVLQKAGSPDASDEMAALGETAWLMDHSAGVVGLRIGGGVMPWSEVRTLHMPSWLAYMEAGEKVTDE